MDADRWVLTDSERDLLRELEPERLAALARDAEQETEALRDASLPPSGQDASTTAPDPGLDDT
ncbi:hypothetical protein [Cellulomonas sp. S1-8]|uniref:hypothetical protein n=1 Tax=Cellulomonas sp. S1-8 TaxID=2904790 RepID=UPI002242C98C|nr:hypothetical protein [Cellulomonas sp. S1-8]UZN01627.1 hypothetical protein OKX07_10965 [Cellulomonas sp. S1-8]